MVNNYFSYYTILEYISIFETAYFRAIFSIKLGLCCTSKICFLYL